MCGEKVQTDGEFVQWNGEKVQWSGDFIQPNGEKVQINGEFVQWNGEKVQDTFMLFEGYQNLLIPLCHSRVPIGCQVKKF